MAATGTETSPLVNNGGGGVAATVAHHTKKRVLRVLPLIALVFFNVSGGPFGAEQSISSGGPLYTILGYTLVSIFWSLPCALVVAELSPAFPHDGGYVVWVREAFGRKFGPFLGFQEGFWSYASGVVDNALYPSLFITYLAAWVQFDLSLWETIAVEYAFIFLLTGLVVLGLDVVGVVSVVLNIIVLAPFLVMIGMGIPRVNASVWLESTPQVQWVNLTNNILWNMNGFDSVSNFAGEVYRPSFTYPVGLTVSVFLVMLVVLLPLMIGVGVAPNFSEWQEGYFSEVSKIIGGAWLQDFFSISSIIANVGMFIAELSTDAYQLCGMAERGMLPKVMAKRTRFRTPWVAILFGMIIQLILAPLDFDIILDLDNFLYCWGLILELVAAIVLRFREPNLYRPFKFPGGKPGLIIGMIIPIGWCLFTIAISTWQIWALGAGSILLGVGLFFLSEYLRKSGKVRFYENTLYIDSKKFSTNKEEYDAVIAASSSESSSVSRYRMNRSKEERKGLEEGDSVSSHSDGNVEKVPLPSVAGGYGAVNHTGETHEYAQYSNSFLEEGRGSPEM
uniref:Amino acid permease n=1 Tax=Palpitomonas bilix TaxID=652834 RepID=A0A7S3G0G1_9EUKA|mmetsp:Transcript_15673/g.39806  ORF Transcript_15673/g.39806 Transcript_15673/m.39806 type:complete len:562 (+) Transcript_15673:122-1807(+)|eukprot:CAMPEP_0113874866 /NCGR_PEP_ID=MMETSP0780_2-20120614/4591_1 /TAXON_ID=652834 /ORGANISM="Palpitomonas bilix" /LENGTH=561 /DNA_ID=CAMNT_0000860725 /DNA_START=155 /DNA_END=1840 /DNA_ORIENTATION=+ /assembly_acc=CAM_ASM_000599